MTLLLTLLPPLLITARAWWFCYRRAIVQARPLNTAGISALGVSLQFAFALFALPLATWLHSQLRPADDWSDIVGGAALLLNLLASPVVGAAIWIFSAAGESARRRRFPPSCDNCGYDLRGCVDGPCPECGQPAGSIARH